MILTLAEAELREVLAVLPYERKGERRGIVTASGKDGSVRGLGATAIELPRARLTEGGEKKEWQSVLIERYLVPSPSPRPISVTFANRYRPL